MIDNTEQIKEFLKFDTKDDFYFITLLKRKKDDINWNMNCNNIGVKNFYIKSLIDFDRKITLIKEISEATNSRVYAWLNKRSFKKCSMKLISAIATNIETENYEGCKRSWDSVCGSYPNDKNKKWIIDVDDLDGLLNEKCFNVHLNILKEILKNIQPLSVENKIIDIIKTLNGYHIITTPFDLQTFDKLYTERTEKKFDMSSIKKDSPTLMYYKDV